MTPYPPAHEWPSRCLAINVSLTCITCAAIVQPAKYELQGDSDWLDDFRLCGAANFIDLYSGQWLAHKGKSTVPP